MEHQYSFAPPRRLGMTLLLVILILMCSVVGISIWQLLQAQAGLAFLVFLISTLLGISIISFIGYRLYALWGAFYTLEREGILLHWGLRVEAIPIHTVEWIYTLQELERLSNTQIPLPLLRLPGAILGTRHLSDGTPIEYMASDSKRLLCIGTTRRIFSISPNDTQAFLFGYHRFIEQGSITPLQSRSIFPSFLVGEIWQNRLTRYLFLMGLFLNLMLVGWVSLIIPTKNEIILGFFSDESMPPTRLLLLPLINGFLFLLNIGFGLFVFRRQSIPGGDEHDIHSQNKRRLVLFVPGKVLTVMLWIWNLIAAMLFFGAIYFIQLPE